MKRHRPSRHDTGLTVIELVVVLAVVALLVGILVPVLSLARSQAHRVRCADALRRLGVGVWSYSKDHFGRLPAYYGADDLAFDTLAMRKPDGSAVNLGLLVGYVRTPGTFYCETGRNGWSPDIAFDSPFNNWNNGDGPPGSWLSAGYSARFQEDRQAHRHRQVDHFNNKVMYSEFLGVDGWEGGGRFSGPIFAPHRGEGYNLLFGDGGVQWVQATAINSLRSVGKDMPGRDAMRDYYLLLDVLPAGGGGQPIGDDDDD
jgi:type II secretory pathway pseudopilin PulG